MPNDKKKGIKAKDTATSRYYKAQKKGGAAASIAKREMKDYFSGSPANKRKETEAQHMTRMSRRERRNRMVMGLDKNKKK